MLLCVLGLSVDYRSLAADFNPPATFTGTVVDEQGRPAAGAQVALTGSDYHIELVHAKLAGNTRAVTIADQDGHFALTPLQHAKGIVAVSENGYGAMGLQEFTNSSRIKLEPWGRIEGVLRIGRRLGTNEQVQLDAFKNSHGVFHNSSVYRTVTDGAGRFSFAYVPPGVRGISHGGIRGTFTVKPGETSHIIVGGTGRAVIGKLVMPPMTATGAKPRTGIVLEAPDYHVLLVQLAADGTFRVDDVPAGTWGLEVIIWRDRVNGVGAERIGAAGRTIVIPNMPGGRSDRPLDLGMIKPVMVHTPQIGETVQPFEVQTTDGGTFKLADHRRQFVLLDLEPLSQNLETDFVRAVWKMFGTDNRLAVLTMKVQPAGGYMMPVAYEETPWPQTHLRDLPWYVQYPLRISLGLPINGDESEDHLPSCMLLGPGGKILAKDLHGDDIVAAVAKVLKRK